MKKRYSIRLENYQGKFIAYLSVKGKSEWLTKKTAYNHAIDYAMKNLHLNVIVEGY